MTMRPFYRAIHVTQGMKVDGEFHPQYMKTKSVTADETLTNEDSGKVILMGPTGIDITLPDPPVEGFNIKIIMA